MTRTATILLLLTLLALPAPAQPQSHAAHQQFVFAYRLLQRGEDRLAAEAFDDYLQRFPQDARRGDGLYFRALLARRLGDNEQAVKLLSGAPAPTLVPPQTPALLLGQALADLGKFDHALAVLEPLDIEALTPELKASVFFLRGATYRGAGNLPAARTQLAAAVELNSPLRPRALLELARLDAQQNQIAQALASLEKCLALNDPAVNAEAARLAGDLTYKVGKYDQALNFYQTVLTAHQTSPHFAPCVVGTLWTQLQLKQFDALLATFTAHRDRLSGPERAEAIYLAGSAHQALGRHDEAIQLLSEVSPTSTSGGRALLKLATSQFELGRYEAMAATIDRLGQVNASSELLADGQFLLAAADARRGDVTGGAARLTKIIDAGEANPYHAQALLQRAALYESAGSLEPAARDYQAYLQIVGFGATSGGAAAALRLIDLQAKLNRHADAQATAEKLLAVPNLDPPTVAQTMYRLALAQTRQQKHAHALATVNQMLEKYPKDRYASAATYQRGLLRMSTGQAEQAVEDLLSAAGAADLEQPLRVNALRLAALRLRQSGQDDRAADALAKLTQMIGAEKLTFDEHLWLGRRLTAQGQHRAALGHLQPLIKSEPQALPGRDRAEAMYLTATCLNGLGETAAAEAALTQVVAMGHGFELQARLELAQLYGRTNRLDEALAEYEGLVSVEPTRIAATAVYDSAMIHRRRAAALKMGGEQAAAAKENESAFKLLKRLALLHAFAELSPLSERGFVELAEVSEELGRPADADAAYRELAEKFPDGAYALYAKALLALRLNQKSEAAFLLKKARELKVDEDLAGRVERALKRAE